MKKSMTICLLALSICAMAQNTERQKYYFEKRMKEVKNLVSLTEDDEQKMASTYNEQCVAQPNEEAEWLFKIAMRKVINDSAKIMTVCEDEITKAATARVPYKLAIIKNRRQLNDEQVKALEDVVFEYEKALRALDFLYPDDAPGYIKAEVKMNEQYERNINKVYSQLGVTNTLMFGAGALRYSKELSLKPNQIDELSQLGWKIVKELPSTTTDKERWMLETKRTKEILTKAQYDRYLECRAKAGAEKEVVKSWTEMKKLNMAAELDSTTTCAAMKAYFTEVGLVKERYHNVEGAEEQKQVELENLNRVKPEVLRKLWFIQNRENKKNALQPNALSW